MKQQEALAVLNKMQLSSNEITLASSMLSHKLGEAVATIRNLNDPADASEAILNMLAIQTAIDSIAPGIAQLGNALEAFMYSSYALTEDK